MYPDEVAQMRPVKREIRDCVYRAADIHVSFLTLTAGTWIKVHDRLKTPTSDIIYPLLDAVRGQVRFK